MNINDILEIIELLSGKSDVPTYSNDKRKEERRKKPKPVVESLFEITAPNNKKNISKPVSERKNNNRTNATSNPVKNLLDFISQYESGGDYNIIYGGKETPLTKMSIGDVLSFQDNLKKQGSPSTAVGRYQIIQPTLKQLMSELDITEDTPFSEEIQDRLATELLKKRGLNSFLAGQKSVEEFGNKLAKEWAALPVLSPVRGPYKTVRPGETYYSGDKLNKARVKPTEVRNILTQLR